MEKLKLRFWNYFWNLFLLIPIVIGVHYCLKIYINSGTVRYSSEIVPQIAGSVKSEPKCTFYLENLEQEIFDLRNEVLQLKHWKSNYEEMLFRAIDKSLDRFYSDQIGLFDYASQYSGGSIYSTPETVPYPSTTKLRIFGNFDWSFNSDPNIILQTQNFPERCFAFYGSKGRIRINLGKPIVVSHVSLEHLRIGVTLSSSPKSFAVLGIGDNSEENLGRFMYDLNSKIIQTFRVIPKNQTFRMVELRILSNYGNDEMTCVHRFRVHSTNSSLNF